MKTVPKIVVSATPESPTPTGKRVAAKPVTPTRAKGVVKKQVVAAVSKTSTSRRGKAVSQVDQVRAFHTHSHIEFYHLYLTLRLPPLLSPLPSPLPRGRGRGSRWALRATLPRPSLPKSVLATQRPPTTRRPPTNVTAEMNQGQDAAIYQLEAQLREKDAVIIQLRSESVKKEEEMGVLQQRLAEGGGRGREG